MFRIIFIKDRFLSYDVIGERGFVFEPNKEVKFPLDFCGYKIWSPSLHFFIVCQKNPFFTLEALLHEIGHLLIYALFFYSKIADRVNRWYDYLYWRILWSWTNIAK